VNLSKTGGGIATSTPVGTAEQLETAPATTMLGQVDTDDRSWWERNRESFSLRSAGSIYALMILVVFFTIRTNQLGRPFYLGSNNVGNLLEQTSIIGMMAIGMTVLLISGNFDLSVASNAAMSSMGAAMLVEPLGPVMAILAGILIGTIGGLINGLIHWYVGLNSFIVTLGTLTAYRGIVLYMNDGAEKVLGPDDRATLKSWAGEHIPEFHLFVALGLLALGTAGFLLWKRRTVAGGLVAVAGLALLGLSLAVDYQLRLAHVAFYTLILLAIVWFILRFTVTGRRLYATGGNRDGARAAGVEVSRYVIGPFVLVGFCAGLAGVINLARVGSVPPEVFRVRELDVIASAIIGGVALTGGSGNVLKTMIGALLLFVMTNGFTIIGLSPFLTEIAIGALVILSAAAYVLAARRAAEAGRV
jgi:D-xylose transport system permease protein